MSTRAAEGHQRERDREGARSRSRSAAGRDIGTIPDIANVRRRSRCRFSLRLFCEVYNPQAFQLGWSADHLEAIARIEEAATLGALYAFAMPRGSGKTTICRMAALWALSYGRRRYVFVIGANASKAEDTLDAIKTCIRFLPDYAADFPEIAYPATMLAGIAHRAAGQTSDQRPTMIEWGKDRIILPTVAPPSNWPRSWPRRADGMVPTSGSAISTSGLTGDGIRGSLLTLTTGEPIRPDLVLLDDPQTPESARSPSQNVTREKLVSADVLGMAGPGKTISAVMPCTVIEAGDFVDRILDRDRYPLWRGTRTKLLRSMPSNMGAWDQYWEVYRRCMQMEPPSREQANAYYRAHRDELDAGAVASWGDRHDDDEVSAVQHAMHLYYRSPRAFAAEYQNEPEVGAPVAGDVPDLQADEVAARLDRLPRGLVQREATRLTAGIDVQGRVLFWSVCAWTEGFGGRVVDYGAWPRQSRAYFAASDAAPSLADTFPDMGLDGRLYAALTRLTEELLGRTWERDGGGEGVSIERCLVDANWGESTQAVYQFCRTSARSAVLLPSHGRGIGASALPMRDWPPRPGERRGRDWLIPRAGQGRGRHVTFDANSWKSFVAGRLLAPAGSPGALWLPGDRPHEHQLLADHLSSECPIPTHGRGRVVHEWRLRPDRRENHWLDCLVLCAVGASVQGLAWSPAGDAGQVVEQTAGPARVKLSDLQKAKRARG